MGQPPHSSSSPHPPNGVAHTSGLNGSDHHHESHHGPIPIGPIPHAQRLREWSLVLRSSGVPFSVRQESSGWHLIVNPHDHHRAMEAISLYEKENRNWPPREVSERLPYGRSLSAPLIFVALTLFFAFTGPARADSPLFSHGIAVSEQVWHGQPWRAVTALTLHADTAHVLGNALSGTLFLSAVNRRLGNGVGPLLTLAGGTLGNLFNAAWYRTGHASLGASTAVFAAVGILAMTQLAHNHSSPQRSRLRRYAPAVAGLALLGMLGSAPHSDLLAHLFGLIAGMLVALPFARRGKKSSTERAGPPWRQGLFGLLAVAIVLGAWGCALSKVG